MLPESRKRFPRHRFQGNRQLAIPALCMSGSLASGGGESVPCISGACAALYFTYLVRGPLIYYDTLTHPKSYIVKSHLECICLWTDEPRRLSSIISIVFVGLHVVYTHTLYQITIAQNMELHSQLSRCLLYRCRAFRQLTSKHYFVLQDRDSVHC